MKLFFNWLPIVELSTCNETDQRYRSITTEGAYQGFITLYFNLFETKIKTTMANNFIALKTVKGLWIEAFTQQKCPEKVYCNPGDGGGGVLPIFG